MPNYNSYVRSEESLHIHYEGESLDAQALGTLERELHIIAVKTLLLRIQSQVSALDRLRNIHPALASRRSTYYSFRKFEAKALVGSTPPILRLYVERIASGSLFQDAAFCFHEMLSSPHFQGVLLNIGSHFIANFIESKGQALYHTVVEKLPALLPYNSAVIYDVPQSLPHASIPPEGDQAAPLFIQEQHDLLDIGPNVASIARDILASTNRRSKVIITTKQGSEVTGKVEIRISQD